MISPAAGSPQQDGAAEGAAAAAAAAPASQQQQQGSTSQQQQLAQPSGQASEGGAVSAEEAARRQKRREAWEREQEGQRRWDLQRRLADISTDVEFLAREVERVRAELEVPLPPLSELPEGERAVLETARKKRLNELLQNHCKKALGHITSHKWSWPFNAPVDIRQYPDYAETIKNPMDFGTIKRRIDQGGYRHPDDFSADVRLVFDNARLYNKPGSDVHVMANTLQERFEERYSATVSARVAEEAALARHQQEEARRRHAEAGARGSTEALEQYCSVLVRYIDEVQACVLDARSAAAALCKPVPRAEKEALARALGALPQDAFELAVGLVMAHHPGLQPYDDFGFDLDALDALTLRQMQSFVRACEAAEEEARQRGGGEGGRPPMAWPQLMLGSGLRPYRPPGARRQRRQAAAAGEVQVKQEEPEEPQAQAPQQRQQGAQPAAGGKQQAAAAGQKRGPLEVPQSTLTPEEVAAAVAVASMMSPLPLPPLPLPPVAGSAVGPQPLSAVPSPRPAPAAQQPATKKQKPAAAGAAAPAAAKPAAAPAAAAAAAAKPGAAPFVPTSAQMAAVAAAGPQQHQLLAQMQTLLNQVQMTQAIAKQQVAATAAKAAGKPAGGAAASQQQQQQQQQQGGGAPGGK